MGKGSKVRFPSIAAVAAELRAVNATIDPSDCPENEHGEVESVDIRLQVYPSGDWAVRVGPSDYDQDHHGFWGCSSLDGRRFRSEDTARDLIDQCRDMHAQSE